MIVTVLIILITSIDVIPSKNQTLCEYCTHVSKLKHCLLSISVFIKSREKGLVTKGYIVKDTHLNFTFKQALHFSTLIIKLFNSDTKLLLVAIATTT